MDRRRIVQLRAKAQSLRATVYIGKDGLTESVADEIARQLEKHKLVKVKLLPSMETDRHKTALELALRSRSVLIEVRGKTVVLAKE